MEARFRRHDYVTAVSDGGESAYSLPRAFTPKIPEIIEGSTGTVVKKVASAEIKRGPVSRAVSYELKYYTTVEPAKTETSLGKH